jgi:ATP-binding cassette subfamily B protein
MTAGPGRTGGPDVRNHTVSKGTLRRTFRYARPYRWKLLGVVLLTALHAGAVALSPLMLKFVIDDGIVPKRQAVAVTLGVLLAVVVVVDAVVMFVQTWLSTRVGQGLLYDLRTAAFAHVQRQPMAFFTRSETGALINRLNSDVLGAQQAVTTLLSQSTATVLTIVLVLTTMVVLSWQLTVLVLVLVPIFLLPTKALSRKLQRLTRERMNTESQMAAMMGERFNIGGAMLTKLYGRPQRENEMFAGKAGAVRDIATTMLVWGQVLGSSMAVLTGLTTAILYGVGSGLAIHGTLKVGTIVAMSALMTQLFGPINQLTNLQVNVLTALVSFDRLFEVLDLEPIVQEKAGAHPLKPNGTTAPDIEFDHVSFCYPNAADVSLVSLEQISGRRKERGAATMVLRDVSFRAPAGKLTALVGLSGGGKTTITHLVPRLYDATDGTVRVGGEDVRELTFDSLLSTVGIVTQDAHLFHDTLRTNLLYAREDATERELVEACEAAQIWHVVSALPDGLDTVVGERGYRFSGGEKQRLALARLLLKASPVVVLDEATAHLDSESEAAIQRALRTALEGRTSLVIAHRLSTIREAHQILVVEGGQIRERGSHEELLAVEGLYADLYRMQFGRENGNGNGSRENGNGAGDPRGQRRPAGELHH